MFCSRSVGVHLFRGISAFALIGLIIYINAIQMPYALLLAIPMLAGALILLRGCPMCWLTGLFQTIANRKKQINH
jgi:hypothetical protein